MLSALWMLYDTAQQGPPEVKRPTYISLKCQYMKQLFK